MGANAKHLDLTSLPRSCPRLTPAAGQYLADAAAVCLVDEGHGEEIALQVAGAFRASYRLLRPEVTEQMRASYGAEEATELGACGIALLVIRERTGLTVQRAFRGGGFDYWLGDADPELPFQNMARLEVSGIRRGTRRRIAARVKEKLQQVGRSADALPAYIVVVEFSTPIVRVERR